MGKTVIVGAIDNYDFEKVEPWVKSLTGIPFLQDTVIPILIVYRGSKRLLDSLSSFGIAVITFGLDDQGNAVYSKPLNLMTDRFLHIWQFMTQMRKEQDISNFITTDVRDVVFQYNPERLLEEMGKARKKIIVAGEGFIYENEPWSKNNFLQLFDPAIFDKFKHREIYCAGVIGGQADAFLDLLFQVYLGTMPLVKQVPGGGGPDQAVLNILLHSEGWNHLVHKTDSIIHCGTTIPAIEAGSGEIGHQYKNGNTKIKNLSFAPYPMESDGEIWTTHHYNTFGIVHQYDRIPAFKQVIEKRYGKQNQETSTYSPRLHDDWRSHG